MRTTGKIGFWDDEKDYGFIEPDSGGERVFIHIKAFSKPSRRPEINQRVSFALSSDKQGRPRAVKAILAGDRIPGNSLRKTGSLPMLIGIIFLILLSVLTESGKMPFAVLVLYVIASLINIVVYAVDKSAAKKGEWRTKESTLHLLSLLGGWPGALFAQQRFRHKSSKRSFRMVFWITVLLNCAGLAWLLSLEGMAMYQSVFIHISLG